MSYNWVRLADGRKACVEGKSDKEIIANAKTSGNEVIEILGILPYPANPRVGNRDNCPTFCFRPDQCVDKSACPREIACCD